MTAGLKKDVSIKLLLPYWYRLRDEAARRRQPMTELINEWIEPRLRKLQPSPSEPDGGLFSAE